MEVRGVAVHAAASVTQFKGRREDDRLLTGQGRYTADWNLPGQLYGYFLRSDRAHAKIVSIDVSAALAMPGVIAVVTGKELVDAGLKPIPAAARRSRFRTAPRSRRTACASSAKRWRWWSPIRRRRRRTRRS